MTDSRESTFSDPAWALFKEFARFEYALKATGYHEGDGPAKACWENFCKSPPVIAYFHKQYVGDLGEAIRYLVEESPRQQEMVEGQLRWRAIKAAGVLSEQLCTYIRRVRDNLFHEDKANQDWNDRQRRNQLIQHSLTVLKALLDASPEVANAYRGNSSRDV